MIKLVRGVRIVDLVFLSEIIAVNTHPKRLCDRAPVSTNPVPLRPNSQYLTRKTDRRLINRPFVRTKVQSLAHRMPSSIYLLLSSITIILIIRQQ